MDKLQMHSLNKVDSNIQKISTELMLEKMDRIEAKYGLMEWKGSIPIFCLSGLFYIERGA